MQAPASHAQAEPALAVQTGAVQGAGLAMGLLLALAPLEFRETTAILGMQLSFPELLATLALLAGAFAVWRVAPPQLQLPRTRPEWRKLLVSLADWRRLPVVALTLWAAVHLASVAWAPADPSTGQSVRAYVAKFALRVTGGVLLALVAVRLARWPVFRRRALIGILVGLALVTVMGVCERLLGREFEPFLQYFRDEPTWMLGEQRLSTVFYHANTQAAYFELTAPFLIVLAASPRLRIWQRLLATIWLLVVAVLLSLTYSRAGLGAAVIGALVLVVAALRGRVGRGRWPMMAWLALLYAATVVGAYAVNPDMRARIGLTDRSYRATYTFGAPCVGHVGETLQLPLHVRNRGEWPLSDRKAPGVVIHRWLTLDGTREKGGWVRTALPDMPPGSQADVQLQARMPAKPGTYALAVDIKRDEVLRISSLGNRMALVECIAAPAHADLRNYLPTGRMPRIDTSAIASVRHLELERSQYWRAALLLWAQRPWLGWGDDRFRWQYHEYVPHEAWDERARAHSWLFETAVDLGLLGVLALAVLMLAMVRAAWLVIRRGAQPSTMIAVATTSALAGLAVHLQVDYFLAYTQVAMLFWPLAGILLAQASTPRELP